MGTYTELIFGARLKDETPKKVINSIKKLLGEEVSNAELDENFPSKCSYLIGCSAYFGVSDPVNKFYYDSGWVLSLRFNTKNYDNEIEFFLEWIKPYIYYASGERNMYAIVISEYCTEPTIYYLNEEK
ncbi:hypothetical protein [Aureivirga sp. CE67]|uniref:hypothetical protein n=1 Tax=Aureivirga sp. CE67 TaxID=1788983 RepID=UPI0018C8E56B|nr:hypothetical protein [Aureivirga sp. CE67]